MTTFSKIQAMITGRAHVARTYYFAYGANTNLSSMAHRCPAAKPLGTLILEDHRLVFSGVADIQEWKGCVVHGALWHITPECERALDRFEGFPNLYVKTWIDFEHDGKDCKAMVYVMRNRTSMSPPGPGYEGTLREGYRHFKMPQRQINRAIRLAENFKPPRERGPKWTEASLAPAPKLDDGRFYDWLADTRNLMRDDDIPAHAFTDSTEQLSIWDDDLQDLNVGKPRRHKGAE